MRIFITGAAGFIGSHVSERLIADGHEVVGIDAFIPYYPRDIKLTNLERLRSGPRFRFIEADLRDFDVTSEIAECDAIIHLAAMAGSASWDQFDLYVECNLIATQRILESMIRAGDVDTRRLVHISTSSVYGTEAVDNEDAPLRPASPYGITKLAAEQLVFAYSRSYGVPALALRYFSIYGPRQRPDMAYYIFIDALLRDRPITIFGDGEQSRGNTYVDDCVEGTVLALHHGQAGVTYNIGGGVPITLNAAIDTIEQIVGRRARREFLPARRGDQRHTLADTSRAQDHFGYRPQIAPHEGLARQVAWQQGLLSQD